MTGNNVVQQSVLAVDTANDFTSLRAALLVKYVEGAAVTQHVAYVAPAAPTGDLVTHELNRRMQCIVDRQPVHVQHLTRRQRRAMKRAADKQEKRG